MSRAAMSMAAVSVPASSANLGPGFDALGMALSIRAWLASGRPPDGAHGAEPTHPAAVAHRAAGGTGELWVRSPIPMGRGLGYSGAMRVGGAALAVAERDATIAGFAERDLHEILAVAGELEGHGDNAAASAMGGVVVVAGDHVARVRLAVSPRVVVWIPSSTTSTDRSRSILPTHVSLEDAAFNVARVALLVAALGVGSVEHLREATRDRLHQDLRLGRLVDARSVLDAGLGAGAWCGWLSGSGPSLAFLCDAADTAVDGALRRLVGDAGLDGTVRSLSIDHDGVRIEPA